MALGIPSPKDGIDGSQVAAFHAAGKDDEIVEYCKRDVETTRDVYKRMIFETSRNTLFWKKLRKIDVNVNHDTNGENQGKSKIY